MRGHTGSGCAFCKSYFLSYLKINQGDKIVYKGKIIYMLIFTQLSPSFQFHLPVFPSLYTHISVSMHIYTHIHTHV